MNNFIEKNFRENEKLLFLRDSTMPLNKPMSFTQFLIQTYHPSSIPTELDSKLTTITTVYCLSAYLFHF